MKMIDLKVETLEKSSLSELVEVYNTLATELGEPQVKRFADKPSGLKRIAKLKEMSLTKILSDDPEWSIDNSEETDPLLDDQDCTDEEMDNYLETQTNMTTTPEPVIAQDTTKKVVKQYFITLLDEEQEIVVDADTVEQLQQKYSQNSKWQLLGKNFVPVYDSHNENKPFTVLFSAKTTKIEYKGNDTLCYIRDKTKTRKLFVAINKPEGASYMELSEIVNLGGMVRVREYLRYDLNRLHGVGVEQLSNNRIRAKCPSPLLKNNYNNDDKLDYYNSDYWLRYEQNKRK